MKPMLASDYIESKLKFPVIIEPKIDGVRGLNMTGTMTGRSLKKHANKHVTEYFSHSLLAGFDGEMAAEHECHPDLCRLTTSALNTIQGTPWILWHVFDYVTPETVDLPYAERLIAMTKRVAELSMTPASAELATHLRCIKAVLCRDLEQLNRQEEEWLSMGYEGVIIRDPNGKHKQGRSTPTEGGLLRIKRFVDFEIRVERVIEGETNTNEAQINELGLQFRSTHQDNMVPNGLVGAIEGTIIKDVFGINGELLFSAGQLVRVGAGRMTKAEREKYMRHPELIVGKIAKCKMFPKGIKDKMRFPNFQCLRSEADFNV